jgi:replication factor C small subunit
LALDLDIWNEKYRPQRLADGYATTNQVFRKQIESWIKNDDKRSIPLPNLLLTGSSGTGKSTLALLLFNELKYEPGDILKINASRENNVDTIRNKIVNFCSTWPIGHSKVVLLDEGDMLSPAAQMILRGEIEKYTSSVRFIITANYANKIIPALHSRFQVFHFNALDQDSYIDRLVHILDSEKVNYEVDDLLDYYQAAYPDLRKGINLLEQNTLEGKLLKLNREELGSKDYLLEMVQLFKQGKIIEARKLVCTQARVEDYDDIYRYFYRNLEIFGDSEDAQSSAIIYIAKGLKNNSLVADPEINLAATMVELSRISATISPSD